MVKSTKTSVRITKQPDTTTAEKLFVSGKVVRNEPCTIQEATAIIRKFGMKQVDKVKNGIATIYTYA